MFVFWKRANRTNERNWWFNNLSLVFFALNFPVSLAAICQTRIRAHSELLSTFSYYCCFFVWAMCTMEYEWMNGRQTAIPVSFIILIFELILGHKSVLILALLNYLLHILFCFVMHILFCLWLQNKFISLFKMRSVVDVLNSFKLKRKKERFALYLSYYYFELPFLWFWSLCPWFWPLSIQSIHFLFFYYLILWIKQIYFTFRSFTFASFVWYSFTAMNKSLILLLFIIFWIAFL